MAFIMGCLAVLSLGSCANDAQAVQALSQGWSGPMVEQHGMTLTYTDSGRVVLRVQAGHLADFSQLEEGPYQRFDSSVFVTLYDFNGKRHGRLLAQRMTHWLDTDLWFLEGDVQMHQPGGRSLYTESMTWDRDSASIYGQEALRIIDEGEEIRGKGFRAEEDLSRYTIFAVSGELNAPE